MTQHYHINNNSKQSCRSRDALRITPWFKKNYSWQVSLAVAIKIPHPQLVITRTQRAPADSKKREITHKVNWRGRKQRHGAKQWNSAVVRAQNSTVTTQETSIISNAQKHARQTWGDDRGNSASPLIYLVIWEPNFPPTFDQRLTKPWALVERFSRHLTSLTGGSSSKAQQVQSSKIPQQAPIQIPQSVIYWNINRFLKFTTSNKQVYLFDWNIKNGSNA